MPVGTPEQVYHNPSNGFVYDFLGNYNEFAGWKDEKGELHLAEDDLWEPEKAAAAPAAKAGKPHWLARYPELVGALKKVVPGLPLPQETPLQASGKLTRQQMRARLEKRGKPVRVFSRPHEMFVATTPEPNMQYIPVDVVHINPAGPLAKIEMLRKNGVILQAEIPKTIIDQLAIKKGDQVFVRPKDVRIFE